MPYKHINLNPDKKRVGDCTIRAIAAATEKDWESVYTSIALTGFCLHDMPSANHVWGTYLRSIGWKRCDMRCLILAQIVIQLSNLLKIVQVEHTY